MTKRKGRKKTSKKSIEEDSELAEDELESVEEEPLIIEETGHGKDLKNLSPADFPEVGELVVATCTKITPHGGYFSIENYEILGATAGFVHISELSRTWVRNIRKHIREGQKAVCRVMRVTVNRQEVDLSIRRVSDSQKRETLQLHKQELRARGIIKAVAERLNVNSDDINRTIIEPLENKYGNLFSVLEMARDDGESVITSAGLSKQIAEELVLTATKELERSSVSLSAKAKISSYDPEGMDLIKESFEAATEATLKKKALDVTVHVISSPEYKIVISADDWKNAEKYWGIFQDSFTKTFKKKSTVEPLIMEFTRE